MLISQAITDLQIIHIHEFKMIVDEKKDYGNQKENVIEKKLSDNVQV